MAKTDRLDFGDGAEVDAKPGPAAENQPHQDVQPDKPDAKPTKKTRAGKPAAKPREKVICQRCKVACEPVPASRGWVKCPKCGWKHKTFDALLEAKRALRGKQERAAR